MYELTSQQNNILSTMNIVNHRIVLVNAKAGCAKTSTSLIVVDHLKPKRALYTAFNKAIVVEGKSKFTTNVECKTLHALALSYVRPKLPIEDFTYLCIKEKLGYPDKMKIIRGIDEFYRSASIDMNSFFEDLYSKEKKLITIAIKYVDLMVEDKVNPTFNFLLKFFHLLLHEGQLDVKYDLMILDEIQDSTGVALEIFKLINAPKKLGLGDPHQSIYGFMNLVNGFDLLKDTINLELNQSFRCSTEIAIKIENYGKQWLHDDFTFQGTDEPKENGLTAYITATNAQIVSRINDLHHAHIGYTLTRPIKDIFACPLALVTAAAGKDVYHKRYKFLETEYRNYTMSGYKTFYTYLRKEVKDEEIHSAIDLLMRFKNRNINVFDVLADAKKSKTDPKTTVGTYFSLKGLEYTTVHIEPDLNNQVENIIERGGPDADNEFTTMKGYYVACSRCQVHLYNAKWLV